MSAGRSFRHRAGRMIWRTPGVEPSAETRDWLGRMIAAHDDEEVTVEQFLELAREWAEYMAPLPEAERVEAASVVNDYVMRSLTGRSLLTVGFERPG